MKIFEITKLNEDPELIARFTAWANRLITIYKNFQQQPAQVATPGGLGGNDTVSQDSRVQRPTADTRPDMQQPQRLGQVDDPNVPDVDDSVARQAQAQQTWNDRYPADVFVNGLPQLYNSAVRALAGDLSPQNVQRLEDVVENDTPKEIVQVLHRRLTSAEAYAKEDLQAAVDEGTAGGFSQAEVDGAKQLLDYLRRLEIRMNR